MDGYEQFSPEVKRQLLLPQTAWSLHVRYMDAAVQVYVEDAAEYLECVPNALHPILLIIEQDKPRLNPQEPAS